LLLLLAGSVKVQRRAAKGNGEWSRQATEKEKRKRIGERNLRTISSLLGRTNAAKTEEQKHSTTPSGMVPNGADLFTATVLNT
jgi:hypothetical protein